MSFDDFRVNIVLRILALLANLFVLMWGYVNTSWQMTLIVCSVLLLLQVVEFIYYVESSNRQFANFIHAITERDFSLRFNARDRGETFVQLADAYNLITREFARLNTERAAQYQLLDALIEHISIAVLCIDASGRIILMNQSAKMLFNVPYVQSSYGLRRVNAELPAIIDSARDGESQLISLTLGGEVLPLSMFATRFHLLDRSYSLVSFQNMRDELASRELDSWQKLIRVLTHEIMNSITPIVSLTSVISQRLVNEAGQLDPQALNMGTLDTGDAQDLLRSLIAIEARGKGLMHFVQSYHSLANTPQPHFAEVNIARLLDRIALLMLPELKKANVTLHTRCEPPTLTLFADVQQVEQVLINLVKNAREALDQRVDGRIRITAGRHPAKGVQITVSDNGPGIEKDRQQDIFVPFYTSKKNGSGIGLSISRQLMLANRGMLSVMSQAGQGAEFTLTFRQSFAQP